MTLQPQPVRIVLAKVGLDGHDRGVKVVARGLRDAGFHVIYAGLWQTPEAVVRTVADEDADWLGLSLLSGTHMTLVPRIAGAAPRADLGHVGVIVGGIIPGRTSPSCWSWAWPASSARAPRWARSRTSCGSSRAVSMIEPLLERFRRRDRTALARLLTLIARGEQREAIRAALPRDPGPARVVAVTGNAGVGKSTLVGKLIERGARPRADRGRPGLRSTKPAHRRRPPGRSRSHARPPRRSRRLHSQPGRPLRGIRASPTTSTS